MIFIIRTTVKEPILTLGECIRKNRKTLGITQQELADRIGVTEDAVSTWELGKRKPDAMLLGSIADALETSAYYLFLLYSDAEQDNKGRILFRRPNKRKDEQRKQCDLFGKAVKEGIVLSEEAFNNKMKWFEAMTSLITRAEEEGEY